MTLTHRLSRLIIYRDPCALRHQIKHYQKLSKSVSAITIRSSHRSGFDAFAANRIDKTLIIQSIWIQLRTDCEWVHFRDTLQTTARYVNRQFWGTVQ